MIVAAKEFKRMKASPDWFKEVGGRLKLCADEIEDLFEVKPEDQTIYVEVRTTQTAQAYPIRPSVEFPGEHDLLWQDKTGVEAVAFMDVTDKALAAIFKKQNVKVLWASVYTLE